MSIQDLRPEVGVGHIWLETSKFEESEAFMREIGMRSLVKRDGIAVLELRGGTHLVLQKKDDVTPGEATFDLMVDNLKQTHQKLQDLGFSPSDIHTGRIHQSFTVQEPSGNTITFYDSHVSAHPV